MFYNQTPTISGNVLTFTVTPQPGDVIQFVCPVTNTSATSYEATFADGVTFPILYGGEETVQGYFFYLNQTYVAVFTGTGLEVTAQQAVDQQGNTVNTEPFVVNTFLDPAYSGLLATQMANLEIIASQVGTLTNFPVPVTMSAGLSVTGGVTALGTAMTNSGDVLTIGSPPAGAVGAISMGTPSGYSNPLETFAVGGTNVWKVDPAGNLTTSGTLTASPGVTGSQAIVYEQVTNGSLNPYFGNVQATSYSFPNGGEGTFSADGSGGINFGVGASGVTANLSASGNLTLPGTASASAAASGNQLINYEQLQNASLSPTFYAISTNTLSVTGSLSVTAATSGNQVVNYSQLTNGSFNAVLDNLTVQGAGIFEGGVSVAGTVSAAAAGSSGQLPQLGQFQNGSLTVSVSGLTTNQLTVSGECSQVPGTGVNNSVPFAQYGDLFTDGVISGLETTTSAALSGTLTSGVAYVLGQRTPYGGGTYSVAASSTSYLDLSNTGTLTVSISGVVTANSLRLWEVVSDSSAITTVTPLASRGLLEVIGDFVVPGVASASAAVSGSQLVNYEQLSNASFSPTFDLLTTASAQVTGATSLQGLTATTTSVGDFTASTAQITGSASVTGTVSAAAGASGNELVNYDQLINSSLAPSFSGLQITGNASVSGVTSLQALTQAPGAGANNETAFLNSGDIVGPYVVSGLLDTVPGPASLTSTMPGGTAYVLGVGGVLQRVVSLGATYTYAASSDTYVDLSDTGVLTYSAVANGATAPAVAADSLRLEKVVTDAVVSPAPTLASSTAAGTLVAGTYEYQLVAHDATGYGLPSAVVSITTTASGEVVLTWVNPLNETSMDVYGRVSGSIGLLASGVTGTTWTDTGAATVGAAPPTAATSNAIQSVTPIAFQGSPTIKFRAYRAAPLSLAGGSFTTIPLDTVPYNPQAQNILQTTGALRVPVAGYYQVSGVVGISPTPSGTDNTAAIVLAKNGSQGGESIYGNQLRIDGVRNNACLACSGIIHFTPSDTLELWAFVQIATNIFSFSTMNFICIEGPL